MTAAGGDAFLRRLGTGAPGQTSPAPAFLGAICRKDAQLMSDNDIDPTSPRMAPKRKIPEINGQPLKPSTLMMSHGFGPFTP